MARPTEYSPEGVSAPFELYPRRGAPVIVGAISSIAVKLGCTSETPRLGGRQAERGAGQRPGLTTGTSGRASKNSNAGTWTSARQRKLAESVGVFAWAELDRSGK